MFVNIFFELFKVCWGKVSWFLWYKRQMFLSRGYKIKIKLCGRLFLRSRFKGIFILIIRIAKKYDFRISYLWFDKLTLASLKSHNICNKTSKIFGRGFVGNIIFHKIRLKRLNGRSRFKGYIYLLRWRTV